VNDFSLGANQSEQVKSLTEQLKTQSELIQSLRHESQARQMDRDFLKK
jgi:hypothetical protein